MSAAAIRPRALAASLGFVVVALLARPLRADAPPPCPPAVSEWLRECAASANLALANERCVDGRLLVDLTIAGEPALPVELGPDPTHAFRAAGGVGLAPVGEFPDWNAVSAPARASFDALVGCAARSTPPLGPGGARADRSFVPPLRERRSLARLPRLLGAALVLGLLALGPRVRALRARPWTAAALLGATLATFLARRAAVDPAYFHQNAHGPMWIAHALCDESGYGPGYRDVFGWVAARGGDEPERAVFAAQAVLASLQPLAAWVACASAGTGAAVAWAAALAFAVDPLSARLASSESYFATLASLLLVATALLAATPGRTRRPSLRFVAAHVAAGLLASEAATIHPSAWLALALLPLVHLAGRGAPGRRVARALAGAAILGVVVAGVAGPTMRSVLVGEVGAQWLPTARALVAPHVARLGVALAASVALLVLAPTRTRPFAVPAAAAVAVAVAASVADAVLPPTMNWVHGASARVPAGAAVAAFAGLCAAVARGARSRGVVAGGVVLVAFGYAAAHRAWITDLPTDALELRAAARLRALLPPRARLVGLAADPPLIGGLLGVRPCGAREGSVLPLSLDELARGRDALPPGAYWYRSSACSTPRALPVCDAFERSADLAPVAAWVLPARPSMVGDAFAYGTDAVRVGLYRARP